MMKDMRSIMKHRWQDKVTNIKVLKRAGLFTMKDFIIRKNLRWTGHPLRMPTDRLPRQVLYSQLPEGQDHVAVSATKTQSRKILRKEILISTRGNLWH